MHGAVEGRAEGGADLERGEKFKRESDAVEAREKSQSVEVGGFQSERRLTGVPTIFDGRL